MSCHGPIKNIETHRLNRSRCWSPLSSLQSIHILSRNQCQSTELSTYQPINPSIHLSRPIYQPMNKSIRLSIHLPIHPSISLHLSPWKVPLKKNTHLIRQQNYPGFSGFWGCLAPHLVGKYIIPSSPHRSPNITGNLKTHPPLKKHTLSVNIGARRPPNCGHQVSQTSKEICVAEPTWATEPAHRFRAPGNFRVQNFRNHGGGFGNKEFHHKKG